MILRFFYFILSIVSISCNGQTDKENESTAKWFFYAFANELTCYNQNGQEEDPLRCEVKLIRTEKINNDTTMYFFSLYSDAVSSMCFLKPLDLVGVSCVNDNYFFPAYHAIQFESLSDSSIDDRMKKADSLLRIRLTARNDVNEWLKSEFKYRGK